MKNLMASAAIGLAMLAAPAAASTIDVNQQTPGNTFGVQNWKVQTSFFAAGVPDVERNNIYAGAFQLTADGLGDFIAFCLQPRAWLNLGIDYTEGTSLVDPSLGNLNNLAANAFFDVKDAITAAAFQMAVWELAHDPSDFDITQGAFHVTALDPIDDASSLAAANQAQTWLDLVKSDQTWADNAAGKSFLILSADGTQDLITNIDNSSISDVPLPASGLMLLAGLAGAGAVARRKARKAA